MAEDRTKILTVGSLTRNRPTRLSRDLRLLRLGEWLMLIYVGIQITAMVRLIGVPGVPAALLLTYRLLDMILIMAFLLIWRKNIKVRQVDAIAIVVAVYPALVGFANGNLNVTFFNDLAIYIAFVAKIIIFRTLLARAEERFPLDDIFARFSRRMIRLALFTAVVVVIAAEILVGAGLQTYYQAPAEITLAAALAISGGNIGLIGVFTIYAALSGKRMIMVGILSMVGISLLTSRWFVTSLIRWLPAVVALLAISSVVIMTSVDLSRFSFVDKLIESYNIFLRSSESAYGFEDFLALIDPGRYVEYLSLKSYLTGSALIFGNGYGFRYELDYLFLQENNIIIYGDVSNAHLTPLAIVAKFGLIGLVGWMLLFLASFRGLRAWNRASQFQFACRIALASLLVQALFSFGLFVNVLTPFLLAVASRR